MISWINRLLHLPLSRIPLQRNSHSTTDNSHSTNASGEQVFSTCALRAPHIDAPAKGTIVIDDDSPLTTASGDVFRQPPWDDLGRSCNLVRNLMYGRILSFSSKGSATRCRSSSSPARATTPYLSSAALQDRYDFAAARAAWCTNAESPREHHESPLRRLGLHRRRNTVLPPGIHEPALSHNIYICSLPRAVAGTIYIIVFA